jgi:2-amino-4-hydroxy-6-hydroxymethyldihydropteridine diphosphokinase
VTRYAIGLGSNEGDRLANLRFGLEGLESLGSISGISALYETEPVGGPEQPPYLNAVVVLDSDREPGRLLAGLHDIEAEAGRVRKKRWGPRTLDLDIVASDARAVEEEGLEIPHPRADEREFVLRPLTELWPGADVGGGVTAAQGLRRLDDQGVDLLRRHWRDDSDLWIGWVLVSVQVLWFAGIGLVLVADGGLPQDEIDLTRIVGGLVALIGIVLALSASRRLGSSITAVPEPAKGSDLVETGPYALARHPIYGGIVLFLVGAALLLESVIGLVLTIGLAGFFTFKSSYEERRLRARHAGYRSYSRRVRHRLIPFLF